MPPLYGNLLHLLQIIQNTTLCIATGCTLSNNILPLHTHLKLQDPQIRQKSHPFHFLKMHTTLRQRNYIQ